MKTEVIMLAGPSGVGKTTICKMMGDFDSNNTFVSGSVSDLLPQTKDMTHSEMLNRDPKELFKEDYQILNLRKKKVKEIRDICKGYISPDDTTGFPSYDDKTFFMDRSFLDNAAYFWLKQVQNSPQCEVEHFIQLCSMLNTTLCDKLILVNFTKSMINEWMIEDNSKRITSNYFQFHVANIMRTILDIWGFEKYGVINRVVKSWGRLTGFPSYKYIEDNPVGYINNIYGRIPVLILNTTNKEDRIKVIEKFLRLK